MMLVGFIYLPALHWGMKMRKLTAPHPSSSSPQPTQLDNRLDAKVDAVGMGTMLPSQWSPVKDTLKQVVWM